jgi:glycosyltransferase involved in cell wall biosynthesis
MKKTVKLFTSIPSHYRKPIWALLLNNKETLYKFYYGTNSKSGIEYIDFNQDVFEEVKDQLNPIKNLWHRSTYIWQIGVISESFRNDYSIAIFLGNMYCISTWIASIICKLRGKKVVFWGHGLYGNEGKLKLFTRILFYKLADYHLLYERRAKKLMTLRAFEPEKLYVVFNSLDYEKHIYLRKNCNKRQKSDVFNFFQNPTIPILIFIGRLTPQKKLEILINAINTLNSDKINYNLLLIGAGSEEAKLKALSEKGLENNWIHFYGDCYDENVISQYLSLSDLCVSPGNVGLTAIHSLSYGTPVCTHSNMNNQMPEAEAIIDGFNGFFFQENSASSLADSISNWFINNLDRNQIRENCYHIIDKYYNPYYQLSVFSRLVRNEKPEI